MDQRVLRNPYSSRHLLDGRWSRLLLLVVHLLRLRQLPFLLCLGAHLAQLPWRDCVASRLEFRPCLNLAVGFQLRGLDGHGHGHSTLALHALHDLKVLLHFLVTLQELGSQTVSSSVHNQFENLRTLFGLQKGPGAHRQVASHAVLILEITVRSRWTQAVRKLDIAPTATSFLSIAHFEVVKLISVDHIDEALLLLPALEENRRLHAETRLTS
mmetsp:Transcript_24277/g.53967  ORF Transcript_24277/g.53967 Transcript_24277/m.53967 type:complete len:213 (+) Transcript_24277:1759-2397(+)